MKIKFSKNIYSRYLSKVICAASLVFSAHYASAQFRIETFDQPVPFNVINKTNILGENITSKGNDQFVKEYLDEEIIAPNSGAWFMTWNGGDFGYEHRTANGSSDGGYIGRKHTRSGSVGIYYVFNNSEKRFAGAEEMTFDFKWDDPSADQSRSFTASVIGMTPSQMDVFYYATVNGGTGTASDNFSGRPRATGSPNSFTPGFRILRDQDIDESPDWTSYSKIESGDGTWAGGDEGFDWIIIGFSAVFKTTQDYEVAKDAFALDNVKLPMVTDMGDAVIPTIKRTEQIAGKDSLAMFASEGGMYYLVAAGTSADIASLKAAAVDSAVAYPLFGNYVKYDTLSDGKYDIYVVDHAGNVSVGQQFNVGTDTYAPLLNAKVTSVYAGFDDIIATMDEAGTLKLVTDGAGASGEAVVSIAAAEKVETALVVPETVSAGQYDLYAIDAAGNASAVVDITVEEPDVAAPVLTITSSLKISTADTITYTSDEPATAIYVVPKGTAAELNAVKAAALDSVTTTTEAGAIAAINLTEGDYVLMAMDRFGNLGASAVSIYVGDILGPVAFEVTSGIVDKGFPIAVTINEDGIIYIVPKGTAEADLEAKAVATDSAFANVRVAVSTNTDGFVKGQFYDVYAKDLRENWSEKLSEVQIADDENDEGNIVLSSGAEALVLVYPNPVANLLNVEAKGLQELKLYDLGGKQLLRSNKSQLDVSAIESGIYLLHVYTEKSLQTVKVIISQSGK